MADLQLYLVNPHFAPDGPDEDAERLEKCRDEAMWYFKRVAQEALNVRTDALIYAGGYGDAPRWVRVREAAKARYEATLVDARKLYEATVDELFKTGEVSEETSAEWDLLMVSQAMAEAAE